MEKDKIIIVSNRETVIVSGNNTNDSLMVEILYGNNLNFEIYCDTSAEQLAFKKGFSVNGNRVRIVEFEDEIYLRAISDKEAIAPICIEECGDSLNVIDLLETDCTSIVEDMKGSIKDISQNFDIVEGRPFLMEDEFSV